MWKVIFVRWKEKRTLPFLYQSIGLLACKLSFGKCVYSMQIPGTFLHAPTKYSTSGFPDVIFSQNNSLLWLVLQSFGLICKEMSGNSEIVLEETPSMKTTCPWPLKTIMPIGNKVFWRKSTKNAFAQIAFSLFAMNKLITLYYTIVNTVTVWPYVQICTRMPILQIVLSMYQHFYLEMLWYLGKIKIYSSFLLFFESQIFNLSERIECMVCRTRQYYEFEYYITLN